MGKLTCDRAKQIDLVDYLAALVHQPRKINRQDYWYLSPLREEKTASFKVNRERNIWYDHGSGQGGDLIDFGVQYFKCSVSDLLQRLSDNQVDFSFQPPVSGVRAAGEKKETDTANKILVLDSRPLAEPPLLQYLASRNITQTTAQPYCKEVDFLLYGKQYRVIGFPNNTGGYELRSDIFKGSSAPKDITYIDNNSRNLSVFEGFFSYLSYLEMQKVLRPGLPNFLVLNSLSFFERSRTLMEENERINLYLDQDKAGINFTAKAQQWDKQKYTDQSHLYKGHKDLNDWLTNKHRQIKHRHRFRM